MPQERDTAQRRAIWKTFTDTERPLNPQEILNLAKVDHPNLGIATIYRTIKKLVEDGLLEPVSMPNQPTRYEISGKVHHHHFICNACEKVFMLTGCNMQAMQGILPANFLMDSHEVFVYGSCEDCRASK